jgi:hypothetical protein
VQAPKGVAADRSLNRSNGQSYAQKADDTKRREPAGRCSRDRRSRWKVTFQQPLVYPGPATLDRNLSGHDTRPVRYRTEPPELKKRLQGRLGERPLAQIPPAETTAMLPENVTHAHPTVARNPRATVGPRDTGRPVVTVRPIAAVDRQPGNLPGPTWLRTAALPSGRSGLNRGCLVEPTAEAPQENEQQHLGARFPHDGLCRTTCF